MNDFGISLSHYEPMWNIFYTSREKIFVSLLAVFHQQAPKEKGMLGNSANGGKYYPFSPALASGFYYYFFQLKYQSAEILVQFIVIALQPLATLRCLCVSLC